MKCNLCSRGLAAALLVALPAVAPNEAVLQESVPPATTRGRRLLRRLVHIQRDLMSQIRGLVKPLGLVLPRTTPRLLPTVTTCG